MPIFYHRTATENAAVIIESGFRDGTGTYGTNREHRGVWISDRPLDANDGAEGDTVITMEVELTAEELDFFEWVQEGSGYREWLIPAETLNARMRSKAIGESNSDIFDPALFGKCEDR